MLLYCWVIAQKIGPLSAQECLTQCSITRLQHAGRAYC